MEAYEATLLYRTPGAPEAAVALILHQTSEGTPELLLIERSIQPGDPWSGQMALPGGRRDPDDRDLCHTAVRETFEEVGIRLGEPVGRLDDTETGRGLPLGPLTISPFVFELEARPPIRSNFEVQEALWVPLFELLDPRSAVEYPFERPGISGKFPAIRYERYTIWGLTYRILEHFFGILDLEFPRP